MRKRAQHSSHLMNSSSKNFLPLITLRRSRLWKVCSNPIRSPSWKTSPSVRWKRVNSIWSWRQWQTTKLTIFYSSSRRTSDTRWKFWSIFSKRRVNGQTYLQQWTKTPVKSLKHSKSDAWSMVCRTSSTRMTLMTRLSQSFYMLSRRKCSSRSSRICHLSRESSSWCRSVIRHNAPRSSVASGHTMYRTFGPSSRKKEEWKYLLLSRILREWSLWFALIFWLQTWRSVCGTTLVKRAAWRCGGQPWMF